MASTQENTSANPSSDFESLEREAVEELNKSLNKQFTETFARVQNDYGEVGKKLASSAKTIPDDQNFVDFLFNVYDGIRINLKLFNKPDKAATYHHVITTSLLMYKMDNQLPINLPCHIERRLIEDRYLRRFLYEFYNDTYESSITTINE